MPEQLGQHVIIRVVSEQRHQIKALFVVEATDYFSVGCYPDPVAGAAEISGISGYDSYGSLVAGQGKTEILCRFPLFFLYSRIKASQLLSNFVDTHEFSCFPYLIVVKRLQFHEPDRQGVCSCQFNKVFDFIAVYASHHDNVEFHGECCFCKQCFKIAHNPVKLVAAGYGKIALSVKRVETEIDGVKPCVNKLIQMPVKQYAVCGEGYGFNSRNAFCLSDKN